MAEQESLKQLIDPLFRFGDMQTRLIEIMLRRCFIYESPILIYKIMSNMNKHELDCLLYNFKTKISSVFDMIYNSQVSKRSRKNWLRVVILFVKKFDLSLPAHHELILHILKVSTYSDSRRTKNYLEVEFNEKLNWILLMKIFKRISKNRILMQKIFTAFDFKKQDIDEVSSYAFSEEYFTTVAHLRLVLLVSLLYQLQHNVPISPSKTPNQSLQKFPTLIHTQQQQQVQSLMNISQQLISQPSQTIFNHQSSLTQNNLLNQNLFSQNINPQTPPPQLQDQASLNNTPQNYQNMGSITPSNNLNNNNNNWIITGNANNNNNGKQGDNLSCHSLLNNQSFAFNLNQNSGPQQVGIQHQNTYYGANNITNLTNINANQVSNKQNLANDNFTLQKSPYKEINIQDKRIIENFFQKSVLLRCDRQNASHYDWIFSSEWFLVQFWMSSLCTSDDLYKKHLSLSRNQTPEGFKWTQKNIHMLLQEIHEFLFLSKFKIYNENYSELLKKVILSFLFEQQQTTNSLAQIPSADILSNANIQAIHNQPIKNVSSTFSPHQLRQDIKKILRHFRSLLSIDLSKINENLFTPFLSYDWRSNTARPSSDIPLYDPGIFYKDQDKNKIQSQFEFVQTLQNNLANNNSQNNIDTTQIIDFLSGNIKLVSTASLVLENLFSIDFISMLTNKFLLQQSFILPLLRSVSLILQYSPIKNQILFHESVDKLTNVLDTTSIFSNQIKKQIQFKLQRIKRTRKESNNMQNLRPNEEQNNMNLQEKPIQEEPYYGIDQNLHSYSQIMKQRSNSKNLQNSQNIYLQQNQLVNKNIANNNIQQNNSSSEKAKMTQQQIIEEFKRRQQQFQQKNGIKEDKIKQNQAENEPLVCNICSESMIKRRIFYISCYIQLDNYYKSYQGLKKDIKQQHNYYLTTCNHIMHKDCVIQHIRTSNLYEQLLQENEYFCQCCFRLSNIFVPYLEQYERRVLFKYNPLKQVVFIDEPVQSEQELEESFDEEIQQLNILDHGIITAQLPKNPQFPLPLQQFSKKQKNKEKKSKNNNDKKKSHAINYFNFPKVQNSDDQSFLQIIQQIEGAGDKNGFGNENSPQKLLEKNMDFQKYERVYREQQQQEINLYQNSLRNQIEKNQNKKGRSNDKVDDIIEDVPTQGVPYLIKKKGAQDNTLKQIKKADKKQKENKGLVNQLSLGFGQNNCSTQLQNQTDRTNLLLNQMQQIQNYNHEMIIVEERKESSIQEEERVLTDYFEPEVDISYLEDMCLRLQHIDIKYSNILICFQSLLINQIEESISNSPEIQDYNILKESFATSKQFDITRNLYLYLKVWSFIEDRDNIHEAYYLNHRQLIEDIQNDNFFIYEVALGKKSNFAAILVNLAILLLNKEEAFLSISAKFIYKYLIYDIVIDKAKNLMDLDIIPDPQNFVNEISDTLAKKFKDLVDFRFIQISYCIWLIYFGKKNENDINNFLNSMLNHKQGNQIKLDSPSDDHTFVLFISSLINSNILLPENIVNSQSYQNKSPLSIATLSDVIAELLTQKVQDDLFFIPIYKKVTQFKNFKKFQLQLTLNLQQSFSDFIQCHFFSKCSICRRYPHVNQEGYYMCLLCSLNFCAKHPLNLCNKKPRQQNQDQSNQQQKFYPISLIEHTLQHHSGMSMFLNYNNSQIVIIKDSEVFIERQLQLYKDRIGRPPNINRDWKSQVSICINTQKELQDLINKKDFDQKCMQIKRILLDQQYDQQQQYLRRQLMIQENQPNQNAIQNQANRQNQNRQNNPQIIQDRNVQRGIINTSQINQQQDSLFLNQQQDTQTVDLNQRRGVVTRNPSSVQNPNSQRINQNIYANNLSNNNNNNINNNNNNLHHNNNQLYTNQQNFSSNIFTTLNF